MSEISSVRTSRVQSIAAKSIVSSYACSSKMSRVSSKSSSVPGSKISALSKATSHLTELLQQRITVDEYGFTDKTCRNCSSHLSIEEIIALSIPLDANGLPLCKIEEINFDEISYICLNCYAEIVSKKSKARDMVLESIRETPLKPVRPKPKAVVGSTEMAKDVIKESRISERSRAKSTSTNNSKQSYKKAPRPVMPFASDPTKFYENIRKDKYNRKKTDLTQYANANFSGGVFVNGLPGESI